MTAILAPVLDQTLPGVAVLDGCPKIGKYLLRHLWVTHDAVRCADQLLRRISADINEILIDKYYFPIEVCPGYNC